MKLQTLLTATILISELWYAWGAELVIINGNIWTMDSSYPRAEAIAIQNGKILVVGKNKDAMAAVTDCTTVINASNKLVIPGFNDSHLHFVSGGLSLQKLNLSGCRSREEIYHKILERKTTLRDGEWITGRGWDHTLFNDGQWPTKAMLDSIAPSVPIFLHRIDGHVAWVNSIALKRANINKGTKSPQGGEILCDENGEPTGILKEAAMSLIGQLIPPSSQEQKYQAILEALQLAKSKGVTSIQDNSGIETIKMYYQIAKKDLLTLRVSEWMDFTSHNPEELKSQHLLYKSFELENLISIGLIKGFVDGTLGSRTAYFFEPYTDDPSTFGLPQYDQNELDNIIKIADSLGFQVGLHCIGAKANWMAINAYQKVSYNDAVKSRRHRLEHAQVLRLEDIPKCADLDIVASMQPTHCTSDLRWAEKRIGSERCKGAYAWRRFLQSGAHIAFGTDWPVEPLDPMRGIYSAVTRKNIETGEPENGWFPDQCLTVEEALYCYTMGSAYGEHKEKIKGSISPGKVADIVMLSHDIFSIPAQEILTTRVVMTIFNGKIIYRAN